MPPPYRREGPRPNPASDSRTPPLTCADAPSNGLFAGGIGGVPVSYTHLDVYKRQVRGVLAVPSVAGRQAGCVAAVMRS
ncbi:hypothetical protein [Streptomyces fragilis]|uniref:hypothetical protein n=1 Tax=Streptomyces fragilis TaxID=67301 RepID=UPI0024DEAE33|nr:hypothetical protein [Streptomyces fragilis]